MGLSIIAGSNKESAPWAALFLSQQRIRPTFR